LFSGKLNNGHCNALLPAETKQNKTKKVTGGIIGIFEEVLIL
jgi:hypothetical protein